MIIKKDRKNLHKKYTNNPHNISQSQYNLNFDVHTLNLLICYALTDNMIVRKSHLQKLSVIIDNINMDNYRTDKSKIDRIKILKKALEAKIKFGIIQREMVMKHMNGGMFEEDTLDAGMYAELSNEEIKWINEMITSQIKHNHLDAICDDFLSIIARMKTTDVYDKTEVAKDFEELINRTQSHLRKTKMTSTVDEMFSLRDGIYEEVFADVYHDSVNPSRGLKCGMQGLNQLIGGEFLSERTYLFFGMPGEGKSTLLLNLAYQLKKYNPDYKTKDPTKCPCIVFLTMENSMKETVERLFTLSTGMKMSSMELNDALNLLKEEGELYLNDKSPIDIIIKYKPNRSVNTNYLYEITEDLEDDGYEVICLIQDYIKRILPEEYSNDMRLDLGNVVNDFKTFATYKGIPVITASQLNRDAIRNVDEARSSGKVDVVKIIGRNNIGESMLVLENADCSIMIAPEEYIDNGIYHKVMGFLRVKSRIEVPIKFDSFFQPFVGENGLQLEEDLHYAEPVFQSSLKKGFNDPTIEAAKKEGRYLDVDHYVENRIKREQTDQELAEEQERFEREGIIKLTEEEIRLIPGLCSPITILQPIMINPISFVA